MPTHDYLCTHLLLNVVEGVRAVDCKADEDDVRVGVGKRPKTIVVLLARGIPKGQLYVFPINLDIRNIVLKDGGDIDLLVCEERVGCSVSLSLDMV